MKIPKASEHEIQQAIINYLRYKRFYVQRLNSGAIPAVYGGKQRTIRLSAKGTPDLMCFRPQMWVNDMPESKHGVQLVFIEVKRPGKKPTPAQEMMIQELESFGARCIVAHSVDEVEQQL